MKKKPIYAVYCTTKYSFGLQYVKATSQAEARRKFKKRFPKQRILDVSKTDLESHDHAI